MYTTNESIERLKEEIIKRENLITLINEYVGGIMEFTEENYHKLCETSLRGGRELGEQLEKVFPFLKLTDKRHFLNDYVFTLNMNGENFTVKIPCSARKNITVIIPKAGGTYITYNEVKQNEEKLKRVNEMFNEKSIIKKAKFIMPKYKTPISLIGYLIAYRKKNYINRLTELKTVLEDRQQYFEKKTKENNEIAKKYNDTIDYFKNNFLPLMLKWTNRVVVAPNDGSMSYNNEMVYTN